MVLCLPAIAICSVVRIIIDVTETRWYTLTAIVVLLGIASLIWGRVSPETGAGPLPPAPAIGHPAADFTLSTPDGQPWVLSDQRGKPVVLNFWATWCGPCRAEMPELQRLHERLASAGVTVLGINQSETPQAIAQVPTGAGRRLSHGDRSTSRRQPAVSGQLDPHDLLYRPRRRHPEHVYRPDDRCGAGAEPAEHLPVACLENARTSSEVPVHTGLLDLSRNSHPSECRKTSAAKLME